MTQFWPMIYKCQGKEAFFLQKKKKIYIYMYIYIKLPKSVGGNVVLCCWPLFL